MKTIEYKGVTINIQFHPREKDPNRRFEATAYVWNDGKPYPFVQHGSSEEAALIWIENDIDQYKAGWSLGVTKADEKADAKE